MATTTATIDIPAPAARVWQLIGGFDSLPDWLPYIPASTLSEGGRVRSLANSGGRRHRRTPRSVRQPGAHVQLFPSPAPFPVTGYRSILTVREVSGGQSRVEWSGTFAPAGV